MNHLADLTTLVQRMETGLEERGIKAAVRRVALVIGNSAYENVSRLANPTCDAQDIASALSRIGISGVTLDGQNYTVLKKPGVTPLIDVGYDELRHALAAFGRAAEEADQAIFYYAGHGIEVNGQNYLIPVDARLAHTKDVDFETVALTRVMGAAEGASGLRLMILDACRNNPFHARLFPTRSVFRGLQDVEPRGNTLVAYSAKHGTVARDGEGAHSPYTSALLAHLERPGLEIVDLFREVKDDVLDATGNQQEPFLYGSLGRRREYLVPLQRTETSVQPPPPAAFDKRAPDFLAQARVMEMKQALLRRMRLRMLSWSTATIFFIVVLAGVAWCYLPWPPPPTPPIPENKGTHVVGADESQPNVRLTPSTTAKVSPSFNCDVAKERVEQVICASDELSRLDVQLNDLHNRLRGSLADTKKGFLQMEQQKWINIRNDHVPGGGVTRR